MNLPGLDLSGSVVGGAGGMKDMGSQQSRFKWMMEGSSPDTSSPENAFHKNGELPLSQSCLCMLALLIFTNLT